MQFKIHPRKILDRGIGIREIKEKALPLTSMGYGKALVWKIAFQFIKPNSSRLKNQINLIVF